MIGSPEVRFEQRVHEMRNICDLCYVEGRPHGGVKKMIEKMRDRFGPFLKVAANFGRLEDGRIIPAELEPGMKLLAGYRQGRIREFSGAAVSFVPDPTKNSFTLVKEQLGEIDSLDPILFDLPRSVFINGFFRFVRDNGLGANNRDDHLVLVTVPLVYKLHEAPPIIVGPEFRLFFRITDDLVTYQNDHLVVQVMGTHMVDEKDVDSQQRRERAEALFQEYGRDWVYKRVVDRLLVCFQESRRIQLWCHGYSLWGRVAGDHFYKVVDLGFRNWQAGQH